MLVYSDKAPYCTSCGAKYTSASRMGCEVFSWLRARAPVATTITSSGSPKREPFCFSSSFKLTISCCTSGPTDSPPSSPSLSSRSNSRRWYNPLRRRPLDHDPEIVRHWVEADQPLASPGTYIIDIHFLEYS